MTITIIAPIYAWRAPSPTTFMLLIELGLAQCAVKVSENGVLSGQGPLNTPFSRLLNLQLRYCYE
jgi:hypothetical protein